MGDFGMTERCEVSEKIEEPVSNSMWREMR
jgi:hypothetical protein